VALVEGLFQFLITNDMLLTHFAPAPALSTLIRDFGIVHLTYTEGHVIPPKAFSPRPGDSLYFMPRDPEHIASRELGQKTRNPSVFVMGQQTSLAMRFIGCDLLAIIVNFQPGALYRLTGISSCEFTDLCVDAEAVFPHEIKFVNEQLNDAASYTAMITIVESYLIERFKRAKKDAHGIEKAARIILQNDAPVRMEWLAEETCLSQKQFERRFHERMGVNPSLFARINPI
jgi:hypothetical protein